MQSRFILFSFSVMTLIAAILTFSSFGQAYTIEPNQGTIGTQVTVTDSGFGSKKGKVLIETTASKIITWDPSGTSITFEITKSLSPGPYKIVVKPKEPKGAVPITYEGAFTMMAPEITSVTPGAGSPGKVIKLEGNYFGSKKGKVSVGGKNSKVLSWEMDKMTGASEATFVVPKRLLSETYGVTVSNKLDTDTLPEGFIYSSEPTPPQVMGTTPADGETNVSRDLEWIYVKFDKQMKFEFCLDISPIGLPAGWNFAPISGLYNWKADATSLRFSRTNTGTPLSPNTEFQITLNPTPSSCTHHFQDTTGRLLDTFTFSFTTGD